MAAPPIFVGLDVAKAQLALTLRPTGARGAVTNDETGMAALVVQLQALQPTLSGARSHGRVPSGRGRGTGERPPCPSWWSILVRGRDLAKATGQWATTEARAARAVAYVAEAVRPVPHPRPDAQPAELRALLAG